jgi:hypothetical protein
MREERQIDVYKRIGGGEPLPSERRTAEAIDDPFVLAQETGVRLQELLVRDSEAPPP